MISYKEAIELRYCMYCGMGLGGGIEVTPGLPEHMRYVHTLVHVSDGGRVTGNKGVFHSAKEKVLCHSECLRIRNVVLSTQVATSPPGRELTDYEDNEISEVGFIVEHCNLEQLYEIRRRIDTWIAEKIDDIRNES